MKKLISLLILTFMICSLFVGCVNKDEKPGPTPNPTPDHSQETEDDGNKEENNDGGSSTENETEEKDEEENTPSPRPTPYSNDNESIEDNYKENEINAVIGTEIGNLMKAVTLNRIDGQGTVSIADHRGKIIVFNIWATWCPPCMKELPDFSNIASEYSDDVVVIAAHASYNNQNAKTDVSTYFSDSKIIFAYDTPYNAAYNAAGGDGYVPYTVVLDRNGIIVYSNSGILSYDQLCQMIGELK